MPGDKKKKVTTGYAYFFDMVWALGGRLDAILEFRRDNEIMWAGEVTANGATFQAQTGKTADLYGSNEGKSTVTFYKGDHTTVPPVVESVTGHAMTYAGTSLLAMDDGFVGDNVSHIPAYTAVVRRTTLIPGWSNSNISGDANAAHVVYYILTEHLGIAADEIDAASFQDAGDTLYTEGLGISFSMNNAASAERWIDEICRHVDMQVYRARATGKWTCRLIRDDYTPSALPSINLERDCQDVAFARKGWEGTATDLVVTYVSRQTWEERTHRVVSPANRELLGCTRTEAISFPFFDVEAAVAQAVARLQYRMFYPIAELGFSISEETWSPEPGDVFKASSSTIGGAGFTDLICRVLAVDTPEPGKQRLEIRAVEDIFGIGHIDLVEIPTSGWIPESKLLNDPVRHATVKDCCQEMNPKESAVFVLCAAPATGTTDTFEAWVDLDVDCYRGEYSGTGTLTAAYSVTRHVDTKAGFTVENPIGLEAVSNSYGAWQRMATIAIIDSGGANWEAMSVRTITDNGNDTFTFSGLIRGIAGTTIREHSSAARVWVLPWNGTELPEHFLDITGSNLASTLSVKVDPVNAAGRGPRTTVNHDYGFRPETPYPIMRPISARLGNDITIQWSPRKRHGGATNVNVDANPSFWDDTPETGAEIEIVDDAGWGPHYIGPTTNEDAAVTRYGIAIEQTYTLRARAGGRYSTEVEVTI